VTSNPAVLPYGAMSDVIEAPVAAAPAARSRLRRLAGHQVTRFLAASAVGFSFDVGLLVLLHTVLGWRLSLATTVAFAATFVLNFGLNRAAFRAQGMVGAELLRYAVLVAVSWLVTVGVTSGLATLGMPYVAAKIVATTVIAVLNFAGYRWFVFRR
jgi:putative flippase GtrA